MNSWADISNQVKKCRFDELVPLIRKIESQIQDTEISNERTGAMESYGA
ncbi:hypothetical protein ABES02_29180 [Neobacillus pocheonensis]